MIGPAQKAKTFTFAGRVTLVKSVLQSMPVYLLSCSWVPKAILDKVKSLFRSFLWGKGDGKRGNEIGSAECGLST